MGGRVCAPEDGTGTLVGGMVEPPLLGVLSIANALPTAASSAAYGGRLWWEEVFLSLMRASSTVSGMIRM